VGDRVVNVRLNLDPSGYRRGAQQAEQDNRRVATSAEQAAATEQAAFNRAATSMVEAAGRAGLAQQRAAERSAQAARAAGAAISESAAQAAAATGRVPLVIGEIPAAFRAAGTAGSRALGQITTASTTASMAIGQTSTAMTAEMAAAATGTERLGLAARLALAEAATAQRAAIASTSAASSAAASAQIGLISRARAASLAWASSVNTAAASSSSAITRAATDGEKGLKILRTGSLLLVAAFVAAAAAAAHFEKSMSAVQAVAIDTNKALSEQRAEMDQLRAAALAAGRDTAYSASQAADAEAELARAGVSVADIVGGALTGALSLAAAGQLDLSEAATVSAQVMNTFGLAGKDVAHIADVLAAGANKSASDVHGLGESLRMGGLVAQQTGLSLEDTVATLSAFADHALIGSDAGTSLKTMLQRLTPQSTEAANMMARLGFSAYDSQGKFVGLQELAGRLQRSFGGLAPEARNAAMSIIFGSDAVRAASVLMGQGSAGIQQYTSAVNDQGAAARVSAIQLDNLSGDLQKLKGSLEVALIGAGGEGNKVLREMAKFITDVVNGFASLPAWAQGTTLAVMGIVGAVGLASAAFLLAIPRIAAFQASLTALSATMPRLAAAATFTTSVLTGPWGIGIGLAVTALGVFGLASRKTKADIQDMTAAVKADSGAIAENVKALVAQKLEQSGALDTARKYGISLAIVTDAALGNKSAIEQVNRALQDHATYQRVANKGQLEQGKSTTTLNTDAKKLQETLQGTNSDLNDSVQSYKNQTEATGGAAKATDQLGLSAAKTADDLKAEKTETDKLSDALNALNGINIESAQAAIGYQSSLADLRKTIDENGRSLDITSEKGRAVKSAILDAADAAMKHAEAVAKQNDSMEAGNIVLGQDIAQLKETMKAAGFTTDQINSLMAAYGQIPAEVTTVIKDPYALQTIKDLETIKQKVEDVPHGKSITVRAPTAAAEADLEAIGFKVEHMKDGTVKVTVPTSDAFSSVNAIQRVINGMDDKDVHVRVFEDYYITNTGKQIPMPQANGGITGMASGGVIAAASGYQSRQAMTADRPILWAEAGPEAYIPLSASKRRRSTELLADVAGRFGYRLAPVAGDLIPARSLAGASPPSASYDQRRTNEVHLHGASRSFAEQRADLMRHLDMVS